MERGKRTHDGWRHLSNPTALSKVRRGINFHTRPILDTHVIVEAQRNCKKCKEKHTRQSSYVRKCAVDGFYSCTTSPSPESPSQPLHTAEARERRHRGIILRTGTSVRGPEDERKQRREQLHRCHFPFRYREHQCSVLQCALRATGYTCVNCGGGTYDGHSLRIFCEQLPSLVSGVGLNSNATPTRLPTQVEERKIA